jgi:stearoyl-CoA desaturase (delta-9 desaturase)
MVNLSLKRSDENTPYDWVNIVFLIATPLVAIFGCSWYAWNYGVTGLEIAGFFLFWMLTGIGITGGYHRYYSHRSYDCNKALQLYYLVFGAAAVQNSVLNWASDHRYHHRYVDQDEDPYNILRGGLFAHILWIFYKDTRDIHHKFQNVPDLLKDKLVRWQDKWYLALVVGVSFVLPTLLGLFDGRWLGHFLFAGVLRIVVVHHMTFFINSAAHIYGTKPFDLDNSARDNWLLSPLTFGEGYHNFHHKFQADYRNGVAWYNFDMTKWWISFFRMMGWAWRLNRTPAPMILKAKLRVEMRSVSNKLAAAGKPERMGEKVQWRLESGRRRLEAAYAQYQHAKIEAKHRKEQWSAEMHKQWGEKIALYKAELEEARRRWREMIRAMNRISHPNAQGLASFVFVVDVLKHFKL